eukprot:TRINITY_DN38438_c0_g1_i1.p1 TRINITY_DN38438_c0_g1~~TRINITY_DN38438_c0_g1_i1.p1  ORF type:complete len:541 (+),score=114.21 TRINITY_DN38438_c0_g1_i1:122-1744(+)
MADVVATVVRDSAPIPGSPPWGAGRGFRSAPVPPLRPAVSGGARPGTMRELWARLGINVPGNTAEAEAPPPVVLLADIGGARRTLANDDDVRELFAGRCPGARVEVEVRELFPAQGAAPGAPPPPACIVFMPVSGEPAAAPETASSTVASSVSSSASGTAARQLRQPRGGRRAGAAGGVAASLGSLRGRAAAVTIPRAPAEPPRTPQPRRPWNKYSPPEPPSQRPRSAPAYRCVPRMSRRQSVEDAEDIDSLRERRDRGRDGIPSYDDRPGRRLDDEWASKAVLATQTETVSGELLESVGLKEEYERLCYESRRRRELLLHLLRARDNVPGVTNSVVVHDVEDWQKGKYCLVAQRDIPKLQQAIASFAELEDSLAVRLRDEGITVAWPLTRAAERIAEPRETATGELELVPKKVILESPWLMFEDIGQILFRFVPTGDASAHQGDVTIFLWMPAPPSVAFTFCIRVGGSSCCAVNTAPRLWRSDATHYRVAVPWRHIQVLLAEDADENRGGSLDIAMVVLQWHGPRSSSGGGGGTCHESF